MSGKNISAKLHYIHKKMNGSTINYNIAEYQESISQIKKMRSELIHKSDNELLSEISKIKLKIQLDEESENTILSAYAICSEVIKRKLSLELYDTQLIGALALNEGKLIEMQTGEGKTLTAVLPAFYNALSGKGVHILTFNDYLAKRDANWMNPVYEMLGLTVGHIEQGMNKDERKFSYNCDITYLTAKEAGFDFLRDNLVYEIEDKVQKEFNYVIIDEADSILIDEARIPLIIAGSCEEENGFEKSLPRFVQSLKEDEDFDFDEYERNFHYTDEGLNKIENFFDCGNLYDQVNLDFLSKLNCAVHAEFLFKKDIDYIIRNQKIELVDEFTGRVADKRRWPDGLQEAIELKEDLELQPKGKILNSTTLQHFVRKYKKLSAMTATAAVTEEEFKRFYDLDIVVIPTFKKCLRIDHNDRIFKTSNLKFSALIDEIINIHSTGRPILVGTRSVAESDFLYTSLKKNNITCEVLNAKNDEYEAELISKAGMFGAITISTNMAGRGTDIKLGNNKLEKEKILELGGLYVIGTNKHESSRIDNQLRGRSGRQGDPGSSRFFISLEDDLFKKFNLNKLIPEGLLDKLDEGEITNKVIKNEVTRVQKIIEGQNLEIKKTVCRYSDLIEKQREIFTKQRELKLNEESFFKLIKPYLVNKVEIESGFVKRLRDYTLSLMDLNWSEYLAKISDLKEGIHFLRLGGEDPFWGFQKKAVEFFNIDIMESEQKIIDQLKLFIRSKGKEENGFKQLKRPSSTWTYLINDDPFENIIGNMLSGNRNIGMSIGLIMTWPLFLIMPLIKKIIKKK